MRTPRVHAWEWLAWMLGFVVLEAFAVFDGAPDTTLTQTTLHHIPGAVIAAFLAWLVVHFGRRILQGRRDGL